MTLNARCAPTVPPLPAPQSMWPARPADEPFGTLLLEAVSPADAPEQLTLPDWAIRTWPVARLGDVTLEARPLWAHLGPDDLRAALRAAGWTPLGPVRTRRG